MSTLFNLGRRVQRQIITKNWFNSKTNGEMTSKQIFKRQFKAFLNKIFQVFKMATSKMVDILLKAQKWIFDVNSMMLTRARLPYYSLTVLLILEALVETVFILTLEDIQMPYGKLVSKEDFKIDENNLSPAQLLLIGYSLLTIISFSLQNNFQFAAYIFRLNILCSPIFFLPSTFILHEAVARSSTLSFVIATLATLLIFTLSYLHHAIHLEYTFQLTNTLAKTSNTWILPNKLVTAAILHLNLVLDNAVSRQVSLGLIFLNLLSQLYKCTFGNLYLVPILAKFSAILDLFKINVTFCSLLVLLKEKDIAVAENRWLVVMVLVFFQTIAYLMFYEYRIVGVLLEDIQNIETEENAELYIRSFSRLGQDVVPQGVKYLEGILRDHKITCKNVDCQCREPLHFDEITYPSKFILSLIRILLSNFDGSKLLQFMLIYCHTEITGTYPLAFYLVQQASFQVHNLTYRWLLYDLRSRLNKHIQNRFQDISLGLNFIFIYQCMLNELKSQTKSVALLAVEKLNLITQYLVDTTKLEQISIKQLDKMTKITNTYSKIQKNKDTKTLLYNYTLNILLDSPAAASIFHEIDAPTKRNKFFEGLKEDTTACIAQLDANQDFLGRVLNCSDRFHSFFGYSNKEQIIGSHFTVFLPAVLRNPFQIELQNWFRTGKWSLFETSRQTFGVNKQDSLISITVFAKLMINGDRFRLGLWLKKNNKSNFGLLESDGKICCLGQNLKHICRTKQLHFQSICPKFQMFLDFQRREEWCVHDMHIISPPESHNGLLSRKNGDLRTIAEQQEMDWYVNEFHEHLDKNRSVYSCRFKIKRMRLIDGTYCIALDLVRIRVSTLALMLKEIPQNCELRQICSAYLNKISLKSIANIFKLTTNQVDESITFGELVQFDTSADFSETTMKLFSHQQKSKRPATIYCSTRGSTIQDFSFKSAIKQIQYRFANPSSPRIIKIMLMIMGFTCAMLVALLLLQLIIGINGLSSYEKILFADAAVSDNMQLLEMFYGKAIQLYQYGSQASHDRLNQIIRNSMKLGDYLYDLIRFSHQQLNLNLAYEDRRSFEYLLYPVDFKIHIQKTKVISSIFIVQYQNAFNHILSTMKTRLFDSQSQNSINVLVSNWETMKEINHRNLYNYLTMSQDLSVYLVNSTIIVMAIYTSLTLFKVSILFVLDRWERKQINKSFLLYQYLSSQDRQTYRTRYNYFLNYIGKTQIPKINHLKTVVSIPGKEIYKHRQRVFQHRKANITFFKYILIVLLLNPSSVSNTLAIFQFVGPCKEMMFNINSLMDSENYQLQALFDLKTHYFYHENSSQQNFTQQFLKKHEQNELMFIQIAIHSLEVFGKFDSNYRTEFTNMLVQDVCLIIENTGLSEEEIKKCRSMKTSMLQQGIMGAMSIMQRKVVEAAIFLEQSPENAFTVFSQPIYEDIDDSIIFMFKVYQLTQARMADALKKAIEDRSGIMKLTTIVQVFFILCFVKFWTYRYKRAKQVQRRKYGYIILLSPDIISSNKHIRMYVSKQISLTLKV